MCTMWTKVAAAPVVRASPRPNSAAAAEHAEKSVGRRIFRREDIDGELALIACARQLPRLTEPRPPTTAQGAGACASCCSSPCEPNRAKPEPTPFLLRRTAAPGRGC